jgi:hypothetical protein
LNLRDISLGHGHLGDGISGQDRDAKRGALGAFATSVEADLVPVTEDSVVSVSGPSGTESVRTVRFGSDHVVRVTVRSAGAGRFAVEFVPELSGPFDVEVQSPAGVIANGRWARQMPVTFFDVGPGPVRFIYGRFHRSRPGRSYQTEWILLS